MEVLGWKKITSPDPSYHEVVTVVVSTFCADKQTNKHTNKQTEKKDEILLRPTVSSKKSTGNIKDGGLKGTAQLFRISQSTQIPQIPTQPASKILSYPLILELAKIKPRLGWYHSPGFKLQLQSCDNKSVVSIEELSTSVDPAVLDHPPATINEHMVNFCPIISLVWPIWCKAWLLWALVLKQMVMKHHHSVRQQCHPSLVVAVCFKTIFSIKLMLFFFDESKVIKQSLSFTFKYDFVKHMWEAGLNRNLFLTHTAAVDSVIAIFTITLVQADGVCANFVLPSAEWGSRFAFIDVWETGTE